MHSRLLEKARAEAALDAARALYDIVLDILRCAGGDLGGCMYVADALKDSPMGGRYPFDAVRSAILDTAQTGRDRSLTIDNALFQRYGHA